MREQVDRQLWEKSLEGDGDAFGVLFDRHYDRVLRHARRLVTSSADAEDVSASAFLELWRKRHRVRLVQDSVLPWLLVTTSNLARNAERGVRRYHAFLDKLPRQEGSAPTAEEELLADRLDLDAATRQAFRDLSAADLQLFSLVTLEDFPIAEAAEALNISVAAAKSRLQRTRHKIKTTPGAFADVKALSAIDEE